VLGGGRYDGLMESLGGAATPAVGWAAGIERLAMLVGERGEKPADVIVVVEDDQYLNNATSLASAVRRSGYACEIVASGSPRKRYDKAVKAGGDTILSMTSDAAGNFLSRVRGSEEWQKRLQKMIDQCL
jgi:histidyl-tRNA synthetase